MPYIRKSDRVHLDGDLNSLIIKLDLVPEDQMVGQLNYCISKIVWALFNKNNCYSRANALMGVLASAQSEFYRRKVAPYEEAKILNHGDIE